METLFFESNSDKSFSTIEEMDLFYEEMNLEDLMLEEEIIELEKKILIDSLLEEFTNDNIDLNIFNEDPQPTPQPNNQAQQNASTAINKFTRKVGDVAGRVTTAAGMGIAAGASIAASAAAGVASTAAHGIGSFVGKTISATFSAIIDQIKIWLIKIKNMIAKFFQSMFVYMNNVIGYITKNVTTIMAFVKGQDYIWIKTGTKECITLYNTYSQNIIKALIKEYNVQTWGEKIYDFLNDIGQYSQNALQNLEQIKQNIGTGNIIKQDLAKWKQDVDSIGKIIDENRKASMMVKQRLDVASAENDRKLNLLTKLTGDLFHGTKIKIENTGKNIMEYKKAYSIYTGKLIEFGKLLFYAILREAKLDKKNMSANPDDSNTEAQMTDNGQAVLPSQDPNNRTPINVS